MPATPFTDPDQIAGPLYADPTRLARRTSALHANAYTHGGGPLRVRITTMTRPCRVVVEVDDVAPARAPTATGGPAGRRIRHLPDRGARQHLGCAREP